MARSKGQADAAIPWTRARLVGAVSVMVVVTGLFLLRRPTQVVHPYVWVEESTILAAYIRHGFMGALAPVHGYLTFPSSPLIALAAAISFVHVPRIDWAFDVGVFLATAVMLIVPSSRWGPLWVRSLMALTLVLVPVGPEVFGVLLLSFWWASLWPVIILGWNRSLWPARIPLLIIAALSSPAGGAFFLLFGASYALGRRSRDLVSAAILLGGLIVQVVLSSGDRNVSPIWSVLKQMLLVAGTYEAAWSWGVSLVAIGVVVFLLLLAGATWAFREGWHEPGLMFLATLVVSAVALAAPAAVGTRAAETPVTAGAVLAASVHLTAALPHGLILDGRYLFLPFVGFAWTLISLLRVAAVERREWIPIGALAAVMLAFSLVNLPVNFNPEWVATKQALSWPHELTLCAENRLRPDGAVPIYSGGPTLHPWALYLTPRECAAYMGLRYVPPPQSR